jgi:outer membrane autotransporter protein
MTAQGPGISGFLAGDGLGGGFNGIGGGPVGLNYADQDGNFSGSFSSSLQQFSRFKSNARAEAQGGSSTPMPANIWVKGHWTKTKNDRGGFNEKSDLGILYLGTDYRFSDDLLIGVMGQVDWAEQESAVQGFEAEGEGWMIGPYMVKRLSGNSIMDLRLAWGQSNNKIRPTGTYWDSYDSERWQIEGNLTGNFDKGNWNIAPVLGLNYFKETQKAYTDSNGFLIGEQDIELGTLSFGPTLTYRMQGNNGLEMRPFVGAQGVWDFKAPDALDLNGIATGTEELRAKVQLGLNLISRRGLAFQASYSYDGIGLSDYESQTGELAVKLPLNMPGLAKGASLRGFYSLTSVSTLSSDDIQQANLELNIPLK